MTKITVISSSKSLANLVSSVLPFFDLTIVNSGMPQVPLEGERIRIIDSNLRDSSLLQQLSAFACSGIPCIVIGAARDLNAVVRIIRAGAVDYIAKPLSRRRLLEAVRSAAGLLGPGAETSEAQRSESGGYLRRYPSPAMQNLAAHIERYADANAPVLISGESGTGKEIVAQSIHDLSPRASGSLVPRNCGAIPHELFESDMFGVATGAYTGAHPREGAFVCAHGGSLFLDEIGELSPSGQVALLRAIETSQVRPVGADKVHDVDVRIIAATNRNLSDAVVAGRFRLDLLYRLNVLTLCVPPLRERPEDLPVLAEDILRESFPDREHQLSTTALHLLRTLPYPGNVREFRNLVVRSAVLSDSCCIDESAVRQALRSDLHAGVLTGSAAGTDSVGLDDRHSPPA